MRDLDPNSPEFIDACMDLIKRSAGRRRLIPSGEQAGEVDATMTHHDTHAEFEALGEADSLRTKLSAMMADRDSDTAAFTLAGRAQLAAATLREEEAQREADGLRHQLASMVTERQAAADTLGASSRAELESAAQREAEAHREAESLRQQLDATSTDRESDTAALREARRRESHALAELQALQTELTNMKALYSDSIQALDAAAHRATQARSEFATAMTSIADRDAAIDHLRLIVSDRDSEINDLQQRLLEAEEARMADAAAILDSLDKYRA